MNCQKKGKLGRKAKEQEGHLRYRVQKPEPLKHDAQRVSSLPYPRWYTVNAGMDFPVFIDHRSRYSGV